MTDTSTAPKPSRRPRRLARASQPAPDGPRGTDTANAAPIRRESKASLVRGLLQRPEGATLEQLVAATGWLPHTARAALTGIRKKGAAVISDKIERQGRVYRIAV